MMTVPAATAVSSADMQNVRSELVTQGRNQVKLQRDVADLKGQMGQMAAQMAAQNTKMDAQNAQMIALLRGLKGAKGEGSVDEEEAAT